ncbi:MAG: hypothetical protein J4445_00190 [DPANN group archaeon]|nr:hypothetical protein [DPANN group archaeon]
MEKAELKQIHKDLEILKRDISLIKNILLEDEIELTEEAEIRLEASRKLPRSKAQRSFGL